MSDKTLVHRQGVNVKLIDCNIILSLVSTMFDDLSHEELNLISATCAN
jgi:hypothetical protein